jgi:hypothetical protein
MREKSGPARDGAGVELHQELNSRSGHRNKVLERSKGSRRGRAALARKPESTASFKERCEARAYLWAACEFDLHQAVDKLQHDAVASGLVAEIGQDAVQAIMTEAFGRVR